MTAERSILGAVAGIIPLTSVARLPRSPVELAADGPYTTERSIAPGTMSRVPGDPRPLPQARSTNAQGGEGPPPWRARQNSTAHPPQHEL